LKGVRGLKRVVALYLILAILLVRIATCSLVRIYVQAVDEQNYYIRTDPLSGRKSQIVRETVAAPVNAIINTMILVSMVV
jgi:hypothetical protein